jgi:cytochrome c peroxidase
MDAREMGAAEGNVVSLIHSRPDLARAYAAAVGRPPPADDDALIADVGKALAAFQETLVTGRTPFDEFRDAVARNDRAAASRYPLDAQRGLKLFVGSAGCNVCHFGPAFTNGEFDKVGIAVRGEGGHFDWGRYDGIKNLLANRFNRLSRHSDNSAGATSTRHVALDVEAYGAFKVPSLRNVALTPPYMHNGSLATLHDVVRHYSEITPEKLHIAAAHPHAEPGEPLPPRPAQSPLRTLSLTERQIDDLVAFLRTLSEPQRDASKRAPRREPHR